MNDFDYWIPPVEDVEKAVAGLDFANIYMLFKDDYANILFCGGTSRDYCAKDHVNFCLELMGLPTINDLELYTTGPDFKFIRPDDCDIPYYYSPQWSIAFQVPLKDGHRLYNYLKEISPLYVTKEQWKKVYSPNNPCIMNDAREGSHQLLGSITVKNRDKYSSGYHLEVNDDIDNIYQRNKALADIPTDPMILMGQDGLFYVAGPDALRQMYQVMAPGDVEVVKNN